MFTRQYRIVTDNCAGYKVQTSFKCLPFWWQIGNGIYATNTSCALEDAKRKITAHRNPPKYGEVKYKE